MSHTLQSSLGEDRYEGTGETLADAHNDAIVLGSAASVQHDIIAALAA
jgi:hypothetical protein